jgi:hypothetical protein
MIVTKKFLDLSFRNATCLDWPIISLFNDAVSSSDDEANNL